MKSKLLNFPVNKRIVWIPTVLVILFEWIMTGITLLQSHGFILYQTRVDETFPFHTEGAMIAQQLLVMIVLHTVICILVAFILDRCHLDGMIGVAIPIEVLTVISILIQTLTQKPESSWKHGITLLLGYFVMAVFALVSRQITASAEGNVVSLRGLLLIFACVVALFTAIGATHPINGSGMMPFGLAISEAYKLFALVFASIGMKAMYTDKNLRHLFIGIIIGLTVLQVALRSVGDAMIFGAIAAGFIIVTSPKLAALLLGGVGLSAVAGYHFLTKVAPDSYMLARIQQAFTLTSAGSNPQLRMSVVALLRNGILGSGCDRYAMWETSSKIFACNSDLVFGTCISTFGVAMGILIIASYAALIFALVLRNESAADPAASLFGQLTAIYIALQVTIAIAGGMKLLPFTGVSLPFLSSGSMQYLSLCVAIGLVLGKRIPCKTAYLGGIPKKATMLLFDAAASVAAAADHVVQAAVKLVGVVFTKTKQRGESL